VMDIVRGDLDRQPNAVAAELFNLSLHRGSHSARMD
jgi:hypothetical protein